MGQRCYEYFLGQIGAETGAIYQVMEFTETVWIA